MGNRLDITVRDYTIRYHALYQEVGTMTDVVISDDYSRFDLSLEDELNSEDPLALIDWICDKAKYNSELRRMFTVSALILRIGKQSLKSILNKKIGEKFPDF